MIFEISNTCCENYPLIEKYPALSKYGYHDEEPSHWGYKAQVIINSIEELTSLSKELNQKIIVDNSCGCDPSIEIYDGWRE
jgi:hypothetical protein